jgi:hypothetical protein
LPRTSAMHDTFSSGAHPGLAKLRPSARLAALLGCTVDELGADLAELVRPIVDPEARAAAQSDHHMRTALDMLGSRGLVTHCPATIDADNRCERKPGHRGFHTHLHDVWDTHTGSLRLRLRWQRCTAVCTDARHTKELRTARCVLELGHESDAHELDNGEVFK